MTARKALSIAGWTFAGAASGITVAMIALSVGDGKPAPLMCGNSVLDPAAVYGALLGFVGGCVVQIGKRKRSVTK